MPGTQSTPLLPGNDPTLAALRHSADQLDHDPSAFPTAAFQQQARLALLHVTPATQSITVRQRLAAKWSGALDRRHLVGIGVGAALFGAVAVPAMAAPPSSIVGAMRGAVGAAIGDVPALLTDGPVVSRPHASDGDDTSTRTATTSATTSSEDERQAERETTTASTVTQSTGDRDDANARSERSSATTTSTHLAANRVTSATSTAAADDDDHGDAVSAAAHTPPPAGENHGREVSGVARRITGSATASATSDSDRHGDEVSSVAHTPPPAGENHGQQVSTVARSRSTSTATTTSSVNAGSKAGEHTDKGNGATAAQEQDKTTGDNGKGHGR